MAKIFATFSLLLLVKLATSEIFSSMAHMESLTRTELQLADYLEAFVEHEEERLRSLKRCASARLNIGPLNRR